MGGFERFCWIVTSLASIAAAAVLASVVFGRPLGMPQDPAFAPLAIGIAVIPYIFTRAIQAMGRDARRRTEERIQEEYGIQEERNWAGATAAAPAYPDIPSPQTMSAPVPEPEVPSPPTVSMPVPEPEPRRPPPLRFSTPRLEPEVPPGEPMLEASDPAPPPRLGLVARDRLVEPPPAKPASKGMGTLFWILVGILVVILIAGYFIIRGGP